MSGSLLFLNLVRLLGLWKIVNAEEKPLEMFDSFEYGTLSPNFIHHIADSITQGDLSEELHWFANTTRFFTFKSHDDVVLQGYHIPGNLTNMFSDGEMTCKAPSDETDGCSRMDTIRPVVFMAGWTESTVKYGKFLHQLHNEGHEIFSFDLRGQGFSASTKYTSKGRKISHVAQFSEFVGDLAQFITSVLPQQLHITSGDRYAHSRILPSYVGFSLSGLVGK